jgi:hypothetical protein
MHSAQKHATAMLLRRLQQCLRNAPNCNDMSLRRRAAAHHDRRIFPYSACATKSTAGYDGDHTAAQEVSRGRHLQRWGSLYLFFAGHVAAASAALAATCAVKTASRTLSGPGIRASLCNCARAAADKPLHAAAALRAIGDWRVRHLLAPLKMMAACCALVLIGRHLYTFQTSTHSLFYENRVSGSNPIFTIAILSAVTR